MGSGWDAIAPFAKTRTVTRTSGAYDTHGRWAAGPSQILSVKMAVQPATQRQMQVLPESVRNRDGLLIHSIQELQIVDSTTGTTGDLLSYNGRNYRVMAIGTWDAGTLDHFQYLAVLAIAGEY